MTRLRFLTAAVESLYTIARARTTWHSAILLTVPTPRFVCSRRIQFGHNALHKAAMFGQPECLKLLLAAGANMEAMSNVSVGIVTLLRNSTTPSPPTSYAAAPP